MGCQNLEVGPARPVIPQEMVYELASTCFFVAGVVRSLCGDHRRRVDILAHGRQLFHRHVAA